MEMLTAVGALTLLTGVFALYISNQYSKRVPVRIKSKYRKDK